MNLQSKIPQIPAIPRMCPHCGSEKFYHLATTRLKGYRLFTCAICRRQFSSISGTVFEGSHLTVEALNEAIRIFNESGGLISGKDFERYLNISYKSAYYLLIKLCDLSGKKRPRYKSFGTNHYKKRSPQYYEHLKLREQRRKDLVLSVLDSGGRKSLEEIADIIAPNHPLESCSQLINSARKWRWLDGKIFSGEIPRIIVRHPIQTRPVYERPEIPNERETEIALLCFRRNMVSLDAPVFDDGSGHGYYNSQSPSPLEILMMKEEMESEEWQERERRLEEWRKFENRKHSAFRDLIQK